ncbi:MAG: VanZ family protein [Bacteroidota bacterium]
MICCLISMSAFKDVGDVAKKDKYVHFAFYFIFTLLWYFFFRLNSKSNTLKLRFVVFLLAFAFGVFIEVCQEFFTIDRSADIHDVFANTSGSLGAIVVIWLAEKFKKKKTV